MFSKCNEIGVEIARESNPRFQEKKTAKHLLFFFTLIDCHHCHFGEECTCFWTL